MSESSKTWIPLKRELQKVGWNYDRIENNLGVPDLVVYVPSQKRDVWIEMKYCDQPEPGGLIEIGLRREQFLWMRKAQKEGRSTFLLVKIGKMYYIWSDVQSWEMAKSSQGWDRMRFQSNTYNGTTAAHIVHLLKTHDFTI